MKLFLYDTGGAKKELFVPSDPNEVKIYVCGPTVYDDPHIGNARSAVVYDVLYRIVTEIFGVGKVKYVRNITDVDDKIIEGAKKKGVPISELTEKTIKDYAYYMEYLNCLKPTMEPRATAHIKEMVFIIEKLLAGGYAYISQKTVYFDVKGYEKYNEFSGRSFSEALSGTRIEPGGGKRNIEDFVLWKPSVPGEEAGVNFDSPWGKGRPGWHIECSAMSFKYLGENFDLHGGGSDLIFPHHTNEIAQSVCAFPGSRYAKYWVHNGFLTVKGEKMSKSLGNFVTVRDIINKGIKGEVLRLFFLSTHYRAPQDFSEKSIEDASKILDYWYGRIESTVPDDLPPTEEFLEALADDMNIPLAIKIINDYAKKTAKAEKDSKEAREECGKLAACARFLGLCLSGSSDWFKPSGSDEAFIDEKIREREIAKKEKNWKRADEIRDELSEKGIVLQDAPGGSTEWRRLRAKNN